LNGLPTLQVGGCTLQLLPQRAAYLNQQRTLLVADLHIGKAVSFRRLGVPVPGGTTSETLGRLSAAVLATGAQRIVFLGDLLHSVRSRAPATWAAVAQWRAQHARLQLTLVRGNHDSHAGDPTPDWDIECLDGPMHIAGLALAHHPDPVPGAYVLAGHIHPAALLGGRADQQLRLPCFHFGPQVGVLPAFGAFTGMHVLPRGPGDRVFVVAEDAVRALPASL
jgi:DNA ligase-associated metallophosphoesterase